MPIAKEAQTLKIGILGCGPIAQSAHFDACQKARNADLYTICDAADDLREKMAIRWEPKCVYSDYDAMLRDSQVDAVLVAVADQFHVPLAMQALAAGKHVLVEKPMGVSVEECVQLADYVRESGLVLQVGCNRRFDPGVRFAKEFIEQEIGARLSLKAWYYDSNYRYTMTDNLQPVISSSASAVRPSGSPKSDLQRYFMLGHGSHLVDTARFLGGEVTSVSARFLERGGTFCWFVELQFADGSLGHLDLSIPICGDFEEGFQVIGEKGSVKGRLHLPWFAKAGDVECFSAKDGAYHRKLGADAYTYKLQIEGFAESILHGSPQHGASADDGLAAMRTMVAIARSAESKRPVDLRDAIGSL